MTRERLIPLLFVVALALDYLFPLTAHVTGAWIVPALMGVSGLVGALKGKRESKNANAAETYKAERQNAIDKYEALLSRAKRGERLRYANSLARTRGFAVPELDPSASEAVNLDLPAVPKLEGGKWYDALGGLAGGLASGVVTDARLNTERGSLPADAGEEAGPPSSAIIGGPVEPPSVATASAGGNLSSGGMTPFDPSVASGAGDPYSALLGRTPYFSNLRPRG